MSGSNKNTGSADASQRWAALDSRNERIVDASHPLLAEIRRSRADLDDDLQAAS